jgi:hypothetical protein
LPAQAGELYFRFSPRFSRSQRDFSSSNELAAPFERPRKRSAAICSRCHQPPRLEYL